MTGPFIRRVIQCLSLKFPLVCGHQIQMTCFCEGVCSSFVMHGVAQLRARHPSSCPPWGCGSTNILDMGSSAHTVVSAVCFPVTSLSVSCTSALTGEAVHRKHFLQFRLESVWETRTHSAVIKSLRQAVSSSGLVHLRSFRPDLPVCRSRD